MIIEKNHLLNKVFFEIGCIIIFVLLIVIPLNCNENFLVHVIGVAMLFCLYVFGKKIMQLKVISSIFMEISRVSYGIFLVQHKVVLMVISKLNPLMPGDVLKALIISVFFSIIIAKTILLATSFVLKSKIYCFLENKYILKTNN